MLNNRISRAALVGLIFTAVCAIAQPKDVDGWGGVKWGMSPEQVKTILAESYSVRQIKDPDDLSRLELIIDEMEISEGLKVQACLSTGKDSRIREVSIERAGKRGGNTPAERSGRQLSERTCYSLFAPRFSLRQDAGTARPASVSAKSEQQKASSHLHLDRVCFILVSCPGTNEFTVTR